MSELETTLAELSDLWNEERAEVKLYFEHFRGESTIIVVLEWTQEYYNAHGADWTPHVWNFYGDTFAEAAKVALEWARELAVFKRCRECDGEPPHVEKCEACKGTGLAS